MTPREHAAQLAIVLDACLDSQECNGYIGCKTVEEARAALAAWEKHVVTTEEPSA